MIDLGMVRPGVTLNVPFSTYDSNDPSASVTTTGLAVGDILIYKDGNLTQRASTSGYAVDTDHDTKVGNHTIQIDLADNGTAGFFSAGSEYIVQVASITVDAATINFWACRFTIGYPYAMLNTTIATLASQTSFTLTKGPAEASALLGCTCIIHDVASEVQLGYGYITAYDVTTKTVTLAAGVPFTAATTDNVSILPPTNVSAWLGTAAATPTVAGVPEVDLTHVMGTILTEGGAGRLAAAFIKLLDVATPTLVASDVMRGTDDAATAAKVLAYVRLLARSDNAVKTDDATELTAINADGGSGAGDYDPNDDAVEGIRDRGDSAWPTAAGFNTTTPLTAAETRTALGLASADLDTQLAAAVTATGFNTVVPDAAGTAPTAIEIWAAITAAAANKIADHTLRRSAATARASSDGDAAAFRSLLGAMSKLHNRIKNASGTLTIYEEDDSTSFGTQTSTGDASADPITELNTD